MAALPSVLKELDAQAAFRIYLTDVIAGFIGVKQRYADLIMPKEDDGMTAQEIADSVIKACGLHEVTK